MDALAPASRSRLAAPRRLLRLRSDTALAERFADGDEAAFSILFERHRASVLAVCIGVLGSRHDAEDAAQEAFASLAVSLHASPPRDLRAWLVRVARNAAIDFARRRQARASVDGDVPDRVSIRAVDASAHVRDELESVVAGIRELPESQRTALLMRELAGHTYREIADLLETDEDAVRGLIARARVGLRRHREAAELPCAAARAAIAAEPDGRRHDKTVRRHVRGCAACRAYRTALRQDARALRGLMPFSAGGAAGGGAVVGGLAAKGALLGTAVTQVTAACAVSVCAVGGIALLAPANFDHRSPAVRSGPSHGRAGSDAAADRTGRRSGGLVAAAGASSTVRTDRLLGGGSAAAGSLAGGTSGVAGDQRRTSVGSVSVPGVFSAPSSRRSDSHRGGDGSPSAGSRPGSSSASPTSSSGPHGGGSSTGGTGHGSGSWPGPTGGGGPGSGGGGGSGSGSGVGSGTPAGAVPGSGGGSGSGSGSGSGDGSGDGTGSGSGSGSGTGTTSVPHGEQDGGDDGGDSSSSDGSYYGSGSGDSGSTGSGSSGSGSSGSGSSGSGTSGSGSSGSGSSAGGSSSTSGSSSSGSGGSTPPSGSSSGSPAPSDD